MPIMGLPLRPTICRHLTAAKSSEKGGPLRVERDAARRLRSRARACCSLEGWLLDAVEFASAATRVRLGETGLATPRR